VVVERRVSESVGRLWDILSRSLNWDVIVLVKVDSGLLLGGIVGNTKKLALYAWV
jgi:hypothetical protein